MDATGKVCDRRREGLADRSMAVMNKMGEAVSAGVSSPFKAPLLHSPPLVLDGMTSSIIRWMFQKHGLVKRQIAEAREISKP